MTYKYSEEALLANALLRVEPSVSDKAARLAWLATCDAARNFIRQTGGNVDLFQSYMIGKTLPEALRS
jgi:hypothetical protein